MRIQVTNAATTAAPSSTARRSASGTFSLDSGSPTRAAAGPSATRSIGGIDTLLALQGVEEPGEHTALPLYEFEPDAGEVLDALLPVYIESRIYSAMLESAASKHAATQRAMKAASDNADTLIREYTRLANNARQQEITQQIAEIVGGADALAG